jgi:hypothetical protein
MLDLYLYMLAVGDTYPAINSFKCPYHVFKYSNISISLFQKNCTFVHIFHDCTISDSIFFWRKHDLRSLDLNYFHRSTDSSTKTFLCKLVPNKLIPETGSPKISAQSLFYEN